jgi:hypothetical protein
MDAFARVETAVVLPAHDAQSGRRCSEREPYPAS